MPIRLLVERRSPDEGKIERGWRLTQVAWKLIRRDRTMLILAVTGVLSASVFSGLILYFGGYFSQSRSTSPGLALLTLVALYPSVLISVYFNVALAAAASAAFDGEQMMVQEALRIAWAKRARIAAWALISATVGALLSTIANRLPLGSEARRLAGRCRLGAGDHVRHPDSGPRRRRGGRLAEEVWAASRRAVGEKS